MRFDQQTNRQRADDGQITKLSIVKKPAHQGALAAIIKSAAVNKEDVEKQQFMEALAQIQVEEMMEEFLSQMWDYTWALRRSIREVLENSEIENKKDAIQQNIRDFATAMGSAVSANTVIKTLGDEDMKKEEVDAMIKEATNGLQAKLDTAEAVAKMNDVVKAHYNTLGDEGKAAFLKMTEDEQLEASTTTQTTKTQDESFEMDGQTIRKSDVGDATFSVLKAQHLKMEKQEAELAKEKNLRKQAEYAKLAEGMYPNLPGEPMAKGAVIFALKSMDKDTQETLESMLKAGNKAMETNNTFKEFGQGGTLECEGVPEAKLNKMAEEKAAKDGISFAKAYDAVLQTEHGQELYNELMG